MTLHMKRWLPYVLIGILATVTTIGAHLHGWTRGYREAERIQERGWNRVAYTLDNRRTTADVERLLGRPVTEGCYMTLYALELDYPVPLLLAVQRANIETRCFTEAWQAETDRAKRQRPAPAKLPGGQVQSTEQNFQTLLRWESEGIFPRIYGDSGGPDWYREEKRRRGLDVQPPRIVPLEEFVTGRPEVKRLVWNSWRPSRVGSRPLTQPDLLPGLKTRFPRLDLVVEYPFAKDGAWVTLGGCLANGREARTARKTLYAVPGVAVVFDRTTRTPTHDSTVPGYVDSACSSNWLHDGRAVAKGMMTPMRAQDPAAERRIPLAKLIPDASHRVRVLDAMEIGEDLEARGVGPLATSLHEIYKVLYRSDYFQTDTDRVSSLKMMFDVWAGLPAPDKAD